MRMPNVPDLLDASSRIALAALLHDLDKLAERASIEHDGRIDAHKTLYCPYHREGSHHSHAHAAYTALGWDGMRYNRSSFYAMSVVLLAEALAESLRVARLLDEF